MNYVSWIMAILVVVLTSPSEAEMLTYLGKDAGEPTGWINLDGVHYRVGPGTSIPGWGTVKEVRDREQIVEKILTEIEKARLREAGAFVHDAFDWHIPLNPIQAPASSPPQQRQ